MDVSIIYVNYNSERLIIDSLDSVLEKTEGVTYEVIVVDNASRAGSAQTLKDKYGDKITVIEAGENLGFGRANNLGIERTDGKYVFLLNPDTVLLNNAVKILFDFLEGNAKAGVAGGNLYTSDGKPNGSFSHRLYPPRLWLLSTVSLNIKVRLMRMTSGREVCFNYKKKPVEVGCIIGADMMIRRAALSDSGLFDKDFFMYAEETELTHRLLKKGWRSWSVPDAKIIHLGGGSSETIREKEQIMRYNSYCLFLYKAFGVRYAAREYKRFIRYFRMRGIIRFRKRKESRRIVAVIKEEYKKFLRERKP